MAKFYGSIVKTGRVGGSVFYVNRGTTIERQYQPIVTNPSTTLQVEQRAKMKLASQLSAILAPELGAFGRSGMQSSRNLFVKDLFNRGAITYLGGKATLLPGSIRLTTSRVAMLANVTATRSSGQAQLTVSGIVLPEYADKVVGVRIVVLQPRAIAGEEGYDYSITNATTVVPSDGSFTATIGTNAALAATVVVYAFMPESEAAVTRYEMLVAESSNEELSLEVVRRQLASGMMYSATSNVAVLAA